MSAHYTPHTILSKRNWDYNKHCQVEFVAYIQASQVNEPNNNNRPRTLDGIYLCPAPNSQGGHHIMGMQMVQYITGPKLFEIPITYVVITLLKNGGGERI